MSAFRADNGIILNKMKFFITTFSADSLNGFREEI
jgi:hypothetical protein